ncbi:MAG: hypothetical protein WC473_06005 [Patescibacteria group bacterium]|jgi:hypothetical protein
MNENSKLHYRYNLFYLLLISMIIIVALLTTEWGAIPNLASLISFGLTLTSLFLSLIAIIFAIFSNFSFSKSAGDLQTASSKICEATDKLQEATLGIEAKIEKIPTLIECLATNFQEGQEKLLSKISEQKVDYREKTVIEINGEVVSRFLKKCSYNGLLFLYSCKLAKDTRIAFKIEDLKLDQSYTHGFMVACTSIGLIQFTEREKIYVITDVDTNLAEKIKDALQNQLAYLLTNHAKFFNKDTEDKRIQELENFFKEK